MSGVQSTKGHLANNGGLRGHSVDPKVFPLVVVAVGNPRERLFWKIRRPDGQYYYRGFDTAAEAEKFAIGINSNRIVSMTEQRYRAAGGYVGLWIGSGPRPSLHRQQTEAEYLEAVGLLEARVKATLQLALGTPSNVLVGADFCLGIEVASKPVGVKTLYCFNRHNYRTMDEAVADGAYYKVGQFTTYSEVPALSAFAKAGATCLDGNAELGFFIE